jgi:hypothetical protein
LVLGIGIGCLNLNQLLLTLKGFKSFCFLPITNIQ